MKKIENFYKKPENLDLVMEEYKNLLDENGVLSMHKSEWFLIKYEDLNELACNYFKYLYLYKNDDDTEVRLPDSLERLDCEDFMDLYQTLQNISDVNKKKEYFKKELEYHSKITDSQEKLREWVIKNEKIGDSDKLYMYCYDWEECAEDDIISFSTQMPDCIPIKVYEHQFLRAIKFYNIFFDLFHHQRLYPESKSPNLPKIYTMTEEEEKQIMKEFKKNGQSGFL